MSDRPYSMYLQVSKRSVRFSNKRSRCTVGAKELAFVLWLLLGSAVSASNRFLDSLLSFATHKEE